MLKGQNIICISSIDWDFVWQGHQEIMSAFAKNGNKVLFIENTGVRTPNFRDAKRIKKRIANWFRNTRGFRKEMENLYVYSPIILPFPYSRLVRWINRRLLVKPLKTWMNIMEFHDSLIWTFLPTGTALDIIDNIEKKLVVYYCIADFYELVDDPKKVKKTEDELLGKCDLVFAQGKILEEKCKRINKNVHIFPFGVNIETFTNFRFDKDRIPADLKGISRPIIGYIGGIHKHIDFDLLRYIAKKQPGWSIVLVGPKQTDTQKINNLPNVFLMGKKEFSELPVYINEFDICIIPYLKSKYTVTVYPNKLNEYHAFGKPVVSTNIPEVLNFNKENDNLVFVGRDYEEFIKLLSSAINNQSRDSIVKRITSAKRHNWQTRIEEMSNCIERTIDEKSGLVISWREGFINFYRAGRKKTLKLALVILSLYFLIFYTSLVWFLASPLKISDKPRKADAIVVFSGGVGESGKVGQGYEERVQYAVELYKKGYANKMIFSSGYKYFFEETYVMKSLAISLGVPENAIILENSASNTYENVKFTKEILKRGKMSNILLVSSPYHMRRASLVFNKIAKDINVTCTPIPNSLFYMPPNNELSRNKNWKKINLQQASSIAHEYLGILYYWFKGRV